ncbi:MAG: C39 family peptidase [Anaerolineales bacterium]|nr:C39 family peptidase [Anaerolineales bacterium]MCB8961179.1 C39 family peptidase [Ardenticatenales bacterium]
MNSDWNRGFDHHRSYSRPRRAGQRRFMRRRLRLGRRGILAGLVGLILVSALVYWQLPAILRLVPSRYLAAYVPRAITDEQFRNQPERLPTAAAPVDASSLLAAAPTAANPPTPTPVIITVGEAVVTNEAPAATAEPSPTATLEPTATKPSTLVSAGAQARLDGVRHEFQTWNNCGPTTLAMALSYFDLDLTQDDTAPILKPSTEDRNVSTDELAAYVNDETDLVAISRANGDLDTLRQLLANGVPVIIEIGIDPPGEYAWLEWYGHYLLVVAYDDDAEVIYTYDSWFGTSEVPGENATPDGRMMDYETLNTYWRQFNRNYVALYRPDQTQIVEAILGDNMTDATMWQNSLAQTQAELSAEPDNGYLWFNLGTIYNALGEFDEAALAFDKAREIGLPWRMLWYQFGPYQAYYETGRYEDVIVLADVTMGDRPYFEESFYFKGLAQIALGQVEEGRLNLQRSIAFNPNYQPAAEALADLDANDN